MKKFFAFVLTLTVLLSSFTARAKGVTVIMQTPSNSSSVQTKDDSILTINVLEQMSWEKIVANAKIVLDSEKWNRVRNGLNNSDSVDVFSKEDIYISHIISDLDWNSSDFDLYWWQLTRHCGLTDIDFDRLILKLNTISGIYDNHNNRKTDVFPTSESSSGIKIYICSISAKYFDNLVSNVGETAHLQITRSSPSVPYWESSQNFGSGAFSIASITNPCVPEGQPVTVTGVSYLDDDGNILSISYEIGHQIDKSNNYMLLFSYDGTDFGWTYPVHLSRK